MSLATGEKDRGPRIDVAFNDPGIKVCLWLVDFCTHKTVGCSEEPGKPLPYLTTELSVKKMVFSRGVANYFGANAL